MEGKLQNKRKDRKEKESEELQGPGADERNGQKAVTPSS